MRASTRTAVVCLVIGTTLAGAWLLHRQTESYTYACTSLETANARCIGHRPRGWDDAAAFALLVAGTAVTIRIARKRSRG